MNPNSDSTETHTKSNDTLSDLETAEILQSLRDTVSKQQHPAAPPTLLPPEILGTGATAEAEVVDTNARATVKTETDHLGETQPSLGAYWDASTMAPLNAVSAAAIARLRAYKPPAFPVWDRLPVSRRAAVLILLFADHRGDLRVVITMRAASLRNFSGHAAFPGGKADSLQETPYQIARREAWEEIGLPQDDSKITKPFHIEYLCQLPCSLAKTELAVRPNVAFLHAQDEPGKPSNLVAESLIPRLDAKEVAAVFSGSLHNFLRAKDEVPEGESPNDLPDGAWYDGAWSHWHNSPWRVHYFHVPVHNQKVTKPKVRDGGQAAIAEEVEEEEERVGRFLVWGLTGRMLVDAARIAYAEEPEFEHNSHYGDEAIIETLEKEGRLPEKKRKEVGLEVTKEDLKESNL